MLIVSYAMKKIFFIFVYIFAFIGFFFVAVFFALKLGLTKTAGIIDFQREAFLKEQNTSSTSTQGEASADFSYIQGTTEWNTFKLSVLKDTGVLSRVSATTNVPSRLIVSVLASEQLRLFFTDREVFKQFFSPLKILGNETQFSWGVMGVKEETAVAIEQNLKNPNSEYYLGPEYEHLLDFKATDKSGIDQERFARITEEHDRYYAYLYGALFIKEIEKQWRTAGFDISKRPEIIGTLYDLGFQKSQPKANPQIGGAEINIDGKIWSFGGLTYDVFYSNEMIDAFPQ